MHLSYLNLHVFVIIWRTNIYMYELEKVLVVLYFNMLLLWSWKTWVSSKHPMQKHRQINDLFSLVFWTCWHSDCSGQFFNAELEKRSQSPRHQLIIDVSSPACLLKDKPITWGKLLRVKPCKQVHVWVTRSRGRHSCMWLRELVLYYPLFTDKIIRDLLVFGNVERPQNFFEWLVWLTRFLVDIISSKLLTYN